MAVSLSERYIAAMVMPERDRPGPRLPRLRRRRFRRIPVRVLVPNVVTLLALCAGLTAIRLAFEDRYALALAAIVFAAILDAVGSDERHRRTGQRYGHSHRRQTQCAIQPVADTGPADQRQTDRCNRVDREHATHHSVRD